MDANGRIVGGFGGRNLEVPEVVEDEIRRLFGRYLLYSVYKYMLLTTYL
jgi:hypothetical protein